MLRFCFNLYIIKVYQIISQLKMPSMPVPGNKKLTITHVSIKIQCLTPTMLPLLVHTHRAGGWLSCLAYPTVCRMMVALITTQKSIVSFFVHSSGSSKIHSGTGMWFWGHSPAGGDSHCHLPCLLAGDGPILPGSFWNR